MLVRSILRRSAAACAATVAVMTLSACGSDEETPEAPVLPTASTEADPEALATEAYQKYWDAYITMSNSGEVQPALLEGVADGAFVELDLKLLEDQAEAGVRRVGEPQFGEFTTTVDGDTATSEVCYDERPWGATSDGATVPGYAEDSTPGLMKATLADRDGNWIVTDLKFTEDASCA